MHSNNRGERGHDGDTEGHSSDGGDDSGEDLTTSGNASLDDGGDVCISSFYNNL